MSQIPQRRHSKDEIAALRARQAMQTAGQNVVNPYNKKLAKTPTVILGYLLAVAAPLYLVVLYIQDKSDYTIVDLTVVFSLLVLSLFIALFISLARSLSRHHASFITIIALIASFSIVHMIKSDPILQTEVKTFLRIGKSNSPSEVEQIKNEILNPSIKPKSADETSSRESAYRSLTPEEREEMQKMFEEVEKNKIKESENNSLSE